MSIINIHDRLSAVLSSAVSIAGMYGVMYYASYRLASSLRSESQKTSNSTSTASKQSEPAPAVPTIMLTPWIKVPLKVPLVLSGSFILSVVSKALAIPQVYPVHEFLKIDEKFCYAAGIVLFAASAYLHYISVKYMVNIRTPIEHGSQVKTACTKGPFAYFKHPTYVAMVGCSLSTVLTFNSAWCLVSPALLTLYLFGILGPREERYMKDYFGRDYIEYTKRVWF